MLRRSLRAPSFTRPHTTPLSFRSKTLPRTYPAYHSQNPTGAGLGMPSRDVLCPCHSRCVSGSAVAWAPVPSNSGPFGSIVVKIAQAATASAKTPSSAASALGLNFRLGFSDITRLTGCVGTNRTTCGIQCSGKPRSAQCRVSRKACCLMRDKQPAKSANVCLAFSPLGHCRNANATKQKAGALGS